MPRKATTLTDPAIKVAKPQAKGYKLVDGGGLFLWVTPSGSKVWRMKYRHAGKEDTLVIGHYPTVSLAQARRKRDESKALLADGIDPKAYQKANEAATQVNALTFESIAREWYSYNTQRWADSTAYKAKLYLENDLLPEIGNKPLKAITRPELVELVRKVEARGTLNAAGKIRQWLHQIFRYALARGVVETNPATDLNVVAAPSKTSRHHPHIPFSELPELLNKLESTRLHSMTRAAIRLLILTAVRPGELRAAPWSEFDLNSATWTISKERMKARRQHIVPLPQQAVVILRKLQQLTGSYPLLFPGQQNSQRPMSENTINKALSLMGYKDRQTGHGFRHLLSTELNNRGYNRDWIERQLAHGDKDEIRDIYNHATYLEQRRQMMQEWADSIDAICTGADVVSIKRKA